MYDVWVDFNDLDHSRRLTTLIHYARPGVELAVGTTVRVGDYDGLEADAIVDRIHGDLVHLTVTGPVERARRPRRRGRYPRWHTRNRR